MKYKIIQAKELAVSDIFTFPPLKLKGRESFIVTNTSKENFNYYSRNDT